MVVIRGEVVQRYPDLTVMALKQTGLDADGRPLLPEAPTGGGQAAKPLFTAFLSPDVMLTGLDITIAELRTPGWWIVVGEHPQAPRFEFQDGGDIARGQVAFAKPNGAHGAAVATKRLTMPARVAFDADDFLPRPNP